MKKNLLHFLLCMSALFSFGTVHAQYYVSESFDGATFPPTGWTTNLVSYSGSDGGGCGCVDWEQAASYGGFAPNPATHSGAGMAWYNSYDMYWGNEEDLISIPSDFTLYSGGTNVADYWIYRSSYDGGYEFDWIDIFAYSPTWGGYYYLNTVYDGYLQYPSESSDGWHQYSVTFPSFFSSYNDVSLVFEAVSEYYVDQYVDDVNIYHIPDPPTISGSTTYCTGDVISLTASSAASSPSYSWTGPGGFTSSSSTITISPATLANAGNYSCVVTSGSVSSSASTVSVVVNQTPDVLTVSATNPACTGYTLSLNVTTTSTAPAATSYSWSGPGGYTSTVQNPTLSPVTLGMAGSYLITASSLGCNSSGSVNVIVNQTPSFTVSTVTSPTTCNCNCGSILFTGLNPTTTYTLSYLQNGTVVGPLTVTTDAVGNYLLGGLMAALYTNITFTLNGCTSTPWPSVSVNNLISPPTPTVGSNSPVCYSTAINFNGTVSAPGYDWTWTGPTTGPATWTYTNSGTTSNPTETSSATFADTGNYFVFVTDPATGCTSPVQMLNVVVKPLPNTPTIISNNAALPNGLCANQTLVLIVNTTTPPGTPATIGYVWTDPTGGTAYPSTPGSNTLAIPNVPANFAGNWTVYSNLNGCNSASPVSFYTYIKPVPGTPTITSNTPVCSGAGYNVNRLIFNVSDTTPGAVYNWSGPGPISPNPNSKLADTITAPSTGASGTYTVFVTNNGCSSASVSTNVVVNQTPLKPTVSPSFTAYCQFDGSVQLNAAGTNLLWHTASTGGSGSSIAPTPNTTVGGLFFWYVTQTANYPGVNCESLPFIDSVLVKDKPNPPVGNTILIYCQNSNVAPLTAIGANLLWYTSFPGTGSPVPPTPSTAVATSTKYYVTQTVNGCESAPLTINVTINAKPAKPTSPNKTYCQNDIAVPLAASGSNLMWYTSSAGGVGTPIAPTPNTAYADTLYYYVTQTVNYPNGVSCESDRAKVMVIVNYQPNALIVTNQPYVCQFDSIFFTYYGNGLSSAAYDWSMPVGATILHGNGQGPIWVRFDSAGKKIVKLQVTDKNCKSPLTTYLLDVRQAPYAPTNVGKEVCQGDILNVSLGYANEHIDKFDWNFDGADVVFGSDGGGPYGIKWNTAGLHTVTMVAWSNSCPSIPITDSVTVHPLADAHIGDVSSSTICAGDSISFIAERYNPAYLYQWLPTNYFGTQTNQGQVYGFVEHSGYITLRVTTEFGCTSQDSTLISAQPCCEVYFPNAFTPNGDGKNDIFRPITRGNQVIKSFQIANRWGQVVFETVNSRVGWDGKFNGVIQDMGTYYYFIKYLCANGKVYEEKGELLLIK